MKVVCAWCGLDMGEVDGRGVDGTTHSICEACKVKTLADLEGDEHRRLGDRHVHVGRRSGAMPYSERIDNPATQA